MHVHGTLKFESARCVQLAGRRFVNTIRCSIKRRGERRGGRSPRLDRDWRPRKGPRKGGDLLSIGIKNEYSWPRLSKHNADRLNPFAGQFASVVGQLLNRYILMGGLIRSLEKFKNVSRYEGKWRMIYFIGERSFFR